jgi:hypothetical protein
LLGFPCCSVEGCMRRFARGSCCMACLAVLCYQHSSPHVCATPAPNKWLSMILCVENNITIANGLLTSHYDSRYRYSSNRRQMDRLLTEQLKPGPAYDDPLHAIISITDSIRVGLFQIRPLLDEDDFNEGRGSLDRGCPEECNSGMLAGDSFSLCFRCMRFFCDHHFRDQSRHFHPSCHPGSPEHLHILGYLNQSRMHIEPDTVVAPHYERYVIHEGRFLPQDMFGMSRIGNFRVKVEKPPWLVPVESPPLLDNDDHNEKLSFPCMNIPHKVRRLVREYSLESFAGQYDVGFSKNGGRVGRGCEGRGAGQAPRPMPPTGPPLHSFLASNIVNDNILNYVKPSGEDARNRFPPNGAIPKYRDNPRPHADAAGDSSGGQDALLGGAPKETLHTTP